MSRASRGNSEPGALQSVTSPPCERQPFMPAGIVAHVVAADRPRPVQGVLGSSAGLADQNDRLALAAIPPDRSCDSGRLSALGICPTANSCGSRTSTTVQASALDRLFQILKIDDVRVSRLPEARKRVERHLVSPRSCGVGLGRRELRVGGKRVARVHRGRSRSHIDRHAQRFEDFLARRAAIDRRLDVKTDAVVAARRN